MDKRDILIVAIVAVVASLAVSAFAPQIGLGPPGGFGSSSVKNAHACSADEICEMNNAEMDYAEMNSARMNHAIIDGNMAIMNNAIIDGNMAIGGDLAIAGELIGGVIDTNAETICNPQRFLDGNGECITAHEIFHSGGALGGFSLSANPGQTNSMELISDLCFSGGLRYHTSHQGGSSLIECKVDCGGMGNCQLIASNLGWSQYPLTCYATCFA